MIRADAGLRFSLLLARTLGYRTLAELEDTMTGAEFHLWAADYQLQPWGEYPADVRSAVNGAVIARSMGAKVDAEDLLPQWDRPDDQTTKRDQFLAWAKANNLTQTVIENHTYPVT